MPAGRRSPPGTSDPGQQRQTLVSGGRVVLAVALAIVLALGTGLATPVVLRAVAPSWTGISRQAAIITADVYLAVIVAHLVAFGGLAGLRDRLRLGRTSARDVVFALAVLVGAWATAGALYVALDPVAGWLDDIRHALQFVGSDGGRLSNADPALFAVAVARACVLAPLGEELLFRGALFGWLRRHLHAGLTITLTAGLFAVIHMLPVVLPLAFILGLGFGWIRERTGSTTPCVIAHVLNNVALVAGAYLVSGWDAGPLAP
jgi:membrane protease YdiL (CAAX protease family)